LFLSVEEKIKQIRESKDITQSALSDILGCGNATVSRIENGKAKYTGEQLKEVRKFLGVEDAPLLDSEIEDFKKRLYFFRDYVKDWRIYEARKLREELSIITQVPFEPNLRILYEMLAIRLLMREGCIESAEKALDDVKALIDETTVENMYHYYYNMGSLNAHKGNYSEAQKFFFTAHNMEAFGFTKEPNLYYNLALCYSKLGMYVSAVSVLERTRNEFNHEEYTNDLAMHFDCLLAINYMRIGRLEQAKVLLDKSLERARNFNRRFFIGRALHNYGCVQLKLNEFEKAIEYFEQASDYFEENSLECLENLYFKIRCLIAMKSPTVKVLLSRAKSLAEKNEHYSLLFESLTHLLTIKNEESLQYIETTTIPYLLEKFEYYRVLDYCELLENVYEKKGNKIKPLEIAAIIRDIYKKILFGR
jgi:tetratricopeptide (TPR) repeat protein